MHDKADAKPRTPKSFPIRLIIAVLVVCILIMILLSWLLTHSPDNPDVALPLASQVTTDNASGVAPTEPEPAPAPAPNYKTIIIKPGDTLAKILSRQGIDNKTIHALLQLGPQVSPLKKLRAKQTLRLLIDTDPITHKKTLTELQLQATELSTITITHAAGKYQVDVANKLLTDKTQFGMATIQTSLSAAIQNAGMPSAILPKLSNIFNWSINLSRDLHPGDTIVVEYKAQYNGDKLAGVGDVVAAELLTKKTTYQAVLYSDGKGNENYYTPQGKSLRPTFLRWPILHGRISSPFSLARRQPILGFVRPHTGTDFAAPYGTPIRATADGIVSFKGTKGGYGRAIMISHGQGYVTLYGHMSSYAKNINQGTRVKQGQTIGYIGTSGLSTGPHVHYEVRINGTFFDPMRVKFPSSTGLTANQIKNFSTFAEQRIAELEKYRESQGTKS